MKLLRFLLKYQLFIALCAASLAAENMYAFPIVSANYQTILASVFFATLFLYNFSRTRLNLETKYRVTISGDRKNLWAAIISFVALICCLLKGAVGFLPIAAAAVLSLFYHSPLILPIKQKKIGLRSSIYFKNTILSMVWVIATVWFPLDGNVFTADHMIHALAVFFFIHALATACDLVDADSDRKEGFKTMATEFSKETTIRFVLLLLVLSGISVFLLQEVKIGFKVATMLAILISSLVVLPLKKRTLPAGYRLAVDGMIVLKTSLVFILS